MDKISKSKKNKIILSVVFAVLIVLAAACFISAFALFNVNVSGKKILFSGEEYGAENIEAIGSSYDGNGVFVSSYYDFGGSRNFKVRFLKEDDSVAFESELVQAEKDGEKDNGAFRTVFSISEDRVLAFTQSWYYWYEVTESGLNLLDSFSAVLDVSIYTYDVLSDGNLDIYNICTKGTTATSQIYIEKIGIRGDRFEGTSVCGDLKKVVGNKNKRLESIGATAMGLAVSADHEKVMVATSSASAVMFDSSLSLLGITDPDEYSNYATFISLGRQAGGTVTAAKDCRTTGELYVCLQDRVLQRVTVSDFEAYGKDGYSIDEVLQLDEYGSVVQIDGQTGILYATNENGNTVYAVDLEENSLLYAVNLQFKILEMVVAEYADRFVLQWTDTVTSENILTSYELSNLEILNSSRSWKIVSIVFGIVFAIAALLFAAMLISGKFAVKCRERTIWFFSNLWKSWKIYLLILPSFILLCVFSLYPSVASIINSFFDYELGKPMIFVGFQNYVELFVLNSSLLLEIARNTVLMVVTYLFVMVVPPVFYAYLINLLRNKRAVNGIRLLLYIPGLLPTIATMLMWRYGIYGINPNGAINTILVNWFGMEAVPFLGSSDYAIWSILFIGFPWTGGFLLFYGALLNIPGEIYDALELDGCGLVKRFFKVDLPFMSGQIKYVSIGALIAGVKAVGRVMATTGGTMGTMTMMYKLYDYLTQNRYGMASAIAVIMVILLAGISMARVRKMLKKEASYD